MSALFVVVTIVRLLVVCLSHPIAAYANNYDFVRQSACVGVWEDYGTQEKTLNHPLGPVDALQYDGDRRPDVCLPSSDNVFPWAMAHLAGKGSHITLRMVGLAKAICAITLLLTIMLQPVAPVVRLGLALSGYCILGDLSLDLYFDTLYLETSVIVPCFAAVCISIIIWCANKRPSDGLLFASCCAIAWLSFARQQYSPFAILIGVVTLAGYAVRWRDSPRAASLSAVVISTQLAFQFIMAHPSLHTRQVDKANRVDTFLGAVLPSATDPKRALAVAGLPPACAASIGLNWYSAGFQTNNPCPAVYDASRTRLLRLFAFDPMTFLRPMARVVSDSRPTLLPYLGHFENPADARRWRFRILRATSFSEGLAALPNELYWWLVVLDCALGQLGLATFFIRCALRGAQATTTLDAAFLLAGMGGALTLYALASSAFGDGFFEVQRHALGVSMGLSLAAAAASMSLVQPLTSLAARLFRRNSRFL